MKNLLIASLILASGLAHGADSGIDPQYVKMKVYKFAVSTSVYCTNPQVVFTNANPLYEDILTSPTFGTGYLRNGSYKCVMLEISDQLKFASDENSDSGSCVMGLENTIDLCTEESAVSLNGQTINCQEGEDKVTIYISTVSTDLPMSEYGAQAFEPPRQGNHAYGINLTNALIVAGPHTGTFVVNGNGQISDRLDGDGTRECEFNPPVFSFR